MMSYRDRISLDDENRFKGIQFFGYIQTLQSFYNNQADIPLTGRNLCHEYAAFPEGE